MHAAGWRWQHALAAQQQVRLAEWWLCASRCLLDALATLELTHQPHPCRSPRPPAAAGAAAVAAPRRPPINLAAAAHNTSSSPLKGRSPILPGNSGPATATETPAAVSHAPTIHTRPQSFLIPQAVAPCRAFAPIPVTPDAIPAFPPTCKSRSDGQRVSCSVGAVYKQAPGHTPAATAAVRLWVRVVLQALVAGCLN